MNEPATIPTLVSALAAGAVLIVAFRLALRSRSRTLRALLFAVGFVMLAVGVWNLTETLAS